MRRILLASLLALTACKTPPPATRGAHAAAASSGPLRNDTERTLYALGLVMGQRMGEFNLTAEELAVVQRGVSDSVLHRTAEVQLREWGPRIGPLAESRAQARGQQEKERGRAFAEQAAREAGAVRTASGMVYRETRAGTGAQPSASDTVRVHYRGTLIDGTEFDTSRGGEPVEFPLNGVIPCWTEGVQRMKVGGTARLVCPSDIAYGDRGQRQIPPGATLVFEVELVGITAPPQNNQPPVLALPADAAAAPAADAAAH